MATKDWEPLILLIGALLTFLVTSFRSAYKEANRGDSEVMKFYIDNISSLDSGPIFSFEFDANLSFKLEQLTGLMKISKTEGDPTYKFKTKRLENLRVTLISETNLFLSNLFRTAFQNKNDDYFSIPIKHKEENPIRLKSELRRLNSTAKSLSNTYEKLCDNFRKLS